MLAKLLSGAGGNSAQVVPTFVSSSSNRVNASTNTVTAPSGIQNGDLLVAVIFSDVTGPDTVTVPAGWSLNYFTSVGDVLGVATKTAASESGNYTFTFSSSVTNTIGILVYRNATRVNTIGVSRVSSTIATAPSITPTYAGVLCAVFTTENSSTISSAPALTQRLTQLSVVPSMAIYEQSPQAASATSSYALTWSGASNNVVGMQLQITNEPTVAPEFVASATGSVSDTSLSITKPSGTVEGDLMFAFMGNATSATWTGDTSWTEILDQGAKPSIRIAYKVAGASEGSSYTFTSSVSSNIAGGIITYRYAAYDAIGTITTGTSPLTLPSVTASLSQCLLLAFGARGANTTVGTPTSMTSRISGTTLPSYNVAEQGMAKGPSGTRSMAVASTTSVAGVMLAIKPTRSL